MASQKDLIKVSLLAGGLAPSSSSFDGGKPAHWQDSKGKTFQNPWPSYQDFPFRDTIKFLSMKLPSVPPDIEDQIGLVRPTWGAPVTYSLDNPTNEEKIKATWLGHACFLVELPTRPNSTYRPARGARILFDPVFSDRCSPSQLIGPKRYTKQPCQIDDIPDIDAVVISHNHYDHCDINTITPLSKRPDPPHIFAPLGNVDLFHSIGIPKDKIHCLDWWEGRQVEVDVGSKTKSPVDPEGAKNSSTVTFDITFTPSQHQANRGLFDRFKSLWGSWVIQEVIPSASAEGEPKPSTGMQVGGKEGGVKVYFAGDTGYRNVPLGADEEKVPFCPAFKEIGERFGEFDFAMIPIGAYEPREFMSRFHVAPQDSVRIFQDIRAKKALGMHWGTWVLTTEEVTEPPRKLAEECKKAGIPDGDFGVCKLGETTFF